MYQFRDPILGFIEVSPLELKIIDSEPFQRLRNIKQLATTYLVYHGAEHSRFGHSLGVMHLVTRAFNAALDNYEADNGELFDAVRRSWYLQILRLIGLTHDLGHAPFSHGSEGLFDNGLEHEDYTKKILFETEISGLISEIGEDFKKNHDVGDEYNITPELIWLVYGEDKPELDDRYIMPDFKFLKSFMDSDLDCDKMDYLLRDSYYCGVNYGKYDLNRLISSLNVYKNEKEHILHLAVERGGIHAFEEFVIARYFMFIQVYFHKTRRYLDILLVKCIKAILPEGKYPSNIQDYLQWDDEFVIQKIKENADSSELASDYIKRKVMSCVYETKAQSNSNSDHLVWRLIKINLKKEYNDDIFILEDEASKLPHKIPMLEQYDSDSGKGIPILLKHADKPSSISVESALLQSLEKPINIKRLYVPKENCGKARQIVSKLLKEAAEDE